MANITSVSPLACPLPSFIPVKGVRLGASAAQIKYMDRPDLMMMVFDKGTSVAGVFTKSRCPGAPIDWCKACLSLGNARALVVNSGNANVFTGRAGAQATQVTAAHAARLISCASSEVFLASTGVIGEILPTQKITDALPGLFSSLTAEGWEDAARAIMTTDTFPKAVSRQVKIGDTMVTIQGIAKGSGMVAPDMATMLAFITTDARIGHDALQTLVSSSVETSFNSITVDSDTSTSDMVLAFATGAAANDKIRDVNDPSFADFRRAFTDTMQELAIMIVKDGEGLSKLIEIDVSGGVDSHSARRIGLAVANSPLVKTAISGEDANWGRIVMAVGKSGEPANRDTLSVGIGGHWIARNGMILAGYEEAPIQKHLHGRHVTIQIDLGLGNGAARIWGCDLTHGYVDINGSYRS